MAHSQTGVVMLAAHDTLIRSCGIPYLAVPLPMICRRHRSGSVLVRKGSSGNAGLLRGAAVEASGFLSPRARVVTAEALAGLGEAEAGVHILADMSDKHPIFPGRLQSINALTFIGPSAKAALPSINKVRRVSALCPFCNVGGWAWDSCWITHHYCPVKNRTKSVGQMKGVSSGQSLFRQVSV